MDELMDKYTDLSNKMLEQALKFQTGNKAAGTRCRIICQELKSTIAEIRNQIQTIKKGN